MEQFQMIYNLGGPENEISTVELPFKQPWKQEKDNALPPESRRSRVHSSQEAVRRQSVAHSTPSYTATNRSGVSHDSHGWGCRTSRKQVKKNAFVSGMNKAASV